MTNKVAFINENDNDSHLDLQLLFNKNINNSLLKNKLIIQMFFLLLIIAFYRKKQSKY